jgi:hypothetical protein
MSTFRCAIIIDKDLPVGLIANTAAVLSLTIGKIHPDLIGHDIKDKDGNIHRGITTIPIPILAADNSMLSDLREAVRQHEPELTVVDFTDAAQMTKTYDDYSNKLSNTPAVDLKYLGLLISGKNKLVNKFTGNLGLLR